MTEQPPQNCRLQSPCHGHPFEALQLTQGPHLVCPTCRRAFPFQVGIPVLLLEEARWHCPSCSQWAQVETKWKIPGYNIDQSRCSACGYLHQEHTPKEESP